ATNATPEQVRRCCRRSRIIGRRFQIVHVMVGQELIEVTTFRALHEDASATDEHGRVLRDNTFGTQSDDAARRDFTVNALYYDPYDETIHDYHEGYADLKQRTLRMIGDPKVRYREDPVRMLRAVRLGAKLNLELDAATRKPIREMADLLDNVPPARLFDEMLKLLTCGDALACLKRLRDEGLHHGVLPLLDVILEQPLGERFVEQALTNTDQRIREGKSISPGFLFAALLWHEVLAHWNKRKAKNEIAIPALFAAMSDVLDRQATKLAITKRLVGDIKEIWSLQPRFEQRSGKRPYGLLGHPRFRAGYDFMLLRAQTGEIDSELGDWWTKFQESDAAVQESLIAGAPKDNVAPAKKRRRRSPNRKRSQNADGGNTQSNPQGE
ncbi:MAG: polynucleotide adenylyltransferase PcnB, partial [Rhodocyclales bacterium]|nr:polynucleotide adenylyltransferase PcnB [Rhodocyclales bacterium]